MGEHAACEITITLIALAFGFYNITQVDKVNKRIRVAAIEGEIEGLHRAFNTTDKAWLEAAVQRKWDERASELGH